MGIGTIFWWQDVLPHINQFGLGKRHWNLEISSAYISMIELPWWQRSMVGNAERVWKNLKECLVEEAVEVCGEHKELEELKTWWGMKEVAALVNKKAAFIQVVEGA